MIFKKKIKTSFGHLFKNLKHENIFATYGVGKNGWAKRIAYSLNVFKNKAGSDFLVDLQDWIKKEISEKRFIFCCVPYPDFKNNYISGDAHFMSTDGYFEEVDGKMFCVANNKNTLSRMENEASNLEITKTKIIVKRDCFSGIFESSISREEYSRSFSRIKNKIMSGEIYQVNFAHTLHGKTCKTPRNIFLDALAKNKVGYSAYFETSGFSVMSLSPEKFLHVNTNHSIESFPIKGTRKIGSGKECLKKARSEILNSEKEKAELTMITDLLRNDLGKVCKFNSIKVVNARKFLKSAQVLHTYSHIKGDLRENVSIIEGFFSIFPGGSVTGCPKKRAMEIIKEEEKEPRGFYCGSIGFINFDGSAEFSILIRTMEMRTGSNEVLLKVGGGIVFDSKEDEEYRETMSKASSFNDIL